MKFSEKGSEKFVTEYNKIEKNRLSPFHDSLIFERAYLTDMIQELIDQKINVDPIIVDGNWCEIDTPQDLENAKKLFC